ncbi:MAG: response regulator, partial [bacterium]|nr:response regulator [bacterium]
MLRVLLVEDNKHDARAAVRAFAGSNPPCDVTHCVRAEHAAELLDAPEGSFDVVLSDLQLPGMHGLEFCKRVISDHPDQATVILTGSGSESMAVEALKAGVDDYIIKDPEGNYFQMLPVVVLQVVRQRRERVARRRAEEERDQLVHSMGERIKELRCMYGVAESIQRRASLEEMFQDVAELIPTGWRYPEITRGKVVFDGKEYVSEPFDETEWRQSSDIVLDGKPCGAVEVYCLEARPELDEGPFLAEERSLIDGIARTLSEAAERKQAGEELQKSNQKHARLANNLIDAFLYRHDLDGVFDYVSASVTQVLGYEPEEFLAHFSEFTTDHPKNQEALEHTALSIRG